MCGIIGFFNPVTRPEPEQLYSLAEKMADTLSHRGPDDQGAWVDKDTGIALGHRRLSIIDLSPTGSQPMLSADGRYVLAFNGEIYNFRALREELPRTSFRGNSDTEVMLAAIEAWGLDRAVARFTGMFAFALYDRREKKLYLVRDRMGEKPLYYGWAGNTFLFGSELKALKSHPEFSVDINREALTLYLRFNYIPAPYSVYKGISKLPPGNILTVDVLRKSEPLPRAYWSVSDFFLIEETKQLTDDKEAVSILDKLLRNAVRRQMVADVPLGAFLSGGVDSSTIVALMQAESNKAVKTFSVGFNEDDYNEAIQAKQIAGHLGTDHTELYVTPKQVPDIIPELPKVYDEPFADSSQIPTLLISKLTRKFVKVSLSGDGGDELFGGYNRYLWGQAIWEKADGWPSALRKAIARGIRVLTPESWSQIYSILAPMLPDKAKLQLPGEKLYKLADIIGLSGPEEMYFNLVSCWKNPGEVVVRGSEPMTCIADKELWSNQKRITRNMMYLDTITYLPDDILVKLDRASMSAGLESRMPFLDHHIVEFALQLPEGMKIRGGQGKWLLRQVLYQYVPKEMTERPKMGFGVPIDSWLRGPLREWAEELLAEKSLREEGFLQAGPIREKWSEHLKGTKNWQYHLWNVLMFQAWLREEGNKIKG